MNFKRSELYHFVYVTMVLVFAVSVETNASKMDRLRTFESVGPQGSGMTVGNMILPSPIANTTNLANHFLQDVPLMKLHFLSKVAEFLSPILQGFLITAMILFALTGTASILCSMIDCSGAMTGFHSGAHGHGFGSGLTHLNPVSTLHHYHQSLPPSDPAVTNSGISKRRDNIRRPWPAQAPSPVKEFQATFNKYTDKGIA